VDRFAAAGHAGVLNMQFAAVLADWQVLLDGVVLTVELSAGAIALGMLAAIGLAAGRELGPRPLRVLVECYVEVIRNTPLLVQLFIVFFGLPVIGIRMGAAAASLLGMTLNLAAYAAEILRAGIESIHRSQNEAGLSLALTRRQVFQYVVLPPAIAKVWPALSGQFILLMLASSICSFISAEELSGAASLVEQQTFRSFETYICATALYLLLALLFKGVLAGIGRILFPTVSGLARVQAKAEAA
jgi:polar amino acid transport system permease protein